MIDVRYTCDICGEKFSPHEETVEDGVGGHNASVICKMKLYKGYLPRTDMSSPTHRNGLSKFEIVGTFEDSYYDICQSCFNYFKSQIKEKGDKQ